MPTLSRPGPRPLAWCRHGPAGAPPVLLLHGLASNASRFAELADTSTLTRDHALLRPDLAGHGGSLTRRRVGLRVWCDDLEALLDAEGGGPAVVVGHSLGARVALELQARAPQRVRSLVLIDPVLRPALHGSWALRARLAPLLAAAAALVRGANALGLHRGALPPLDLRALDEEARVALASPEAEAAFVARYSSARADLRHVPTAVYLQDLAALFAPLPAVAVPKPSLVLQSTGATFADPEATRAALDAPGTRFEAIHCHHWPLTERPREVREAIERWVRAGVYGV